jgi:hypothetical protein
MLIASAFAAIFQTTQSHWREHLSMGGAHLAAVQPDTPKSAHQGPLQSFEADSAAAGGIAEPSLLFTSPRRQAPFAEVAALRAADLVQQ